MITNIIDLAFHHSHNVTLTSQDCTAVSIDTRTALARFIGWLWEDTREWVWVPPGFENPYLNLLKPVPLGQVRVFAGAGTGCPGIPEGYP